MPRSYSCARTKPAAWPSRPVLRRHLCIVALVLASSSGRLTRSEDWLRFRGPNGDGVSDASGLPADWSNEELLAWKAPLPGKGSSSPIVVGDRIFLTYYDGYGLSVESPGREEDLMRHVLCLRRGDGGKLWDYAEPAAQPEAGYVDFMPTHGFVTHTPVSDGERVFAFLGKSGVFAFDLAGDKLWQADVGKKFHAWGSAASPMLVGELLIVNSSLESGSIRALDKRTGELVWQAKKLHSSWSTPIVARTEEGVEELVVCVQRKVVGLDLKTGEELWHMDNGLPQSSPSPVTKDGIIYFVDRNPARVFALRCGGRGDVGQSHLVWSADDVETGITSPVLYEGRLYCLSTRGVLTCLDAESGDVLYRERASGGSAEFYASPLAADGKIFAVSRRDGAFVFAAGDEFEPLAENGFPGDGGLFNASPIVHDGQLLIRSEKFLYCIGASK